MTKQIPTTQLQAKGLGVTKLHCAHALHCGPERRETEGQRLSPRWDKLPRFLAAVGTSGLLWPSGRVLLSS